MNPNIAMSDSNRQSVVEILNALLADEYVLYTKTRNYHWNVVGPQFNDLHKFFEAQYEDLDGIVDEVAERARPRRPRLRHARGVRAAHAAQEAPGRLPRRRRDAEAPARRP